MSCCENDKVEIVYVLMYFDNYYKNFKNYGNLYIK